MRYLTENQLVIQDTTTTDLGVTTSVPDSGVMEKIIQKFATMHKTYSPEKKITYLLKACKLIYDAMATGNPGMCSVLHMISSSICSPFLLLIMSFIVLLEGLDLIQGYASFFP